MLKRFFFILIVIVIASFSSYSSNSIIHIGVLKEVYPFCYYEDNKYVGKEIKLIKDIYHSDYYKYEFKKIKNLSNYENFDFIIGGLIDSKLVNTKFFEYNKFNYFSDKILLLRNKNSEKLSIFDIFKNKTISVKLYSLSYYITNDIENRKMFAFYNDFLNYLNTNKIEYGLIDQVDIDKNELDKYDNIVIDDIVYQEDYIILINNKLKINKELLNRIEIYD